MDERGNKKRGEVLPGEVLPGEILVKEARELISEIEAKLSEAVELGQALVEEFLDDRFPSSNNSIAFQIRDCSYLVVKRRDRCNGYYIQRRRSNDEVRDTTSVEVDLTNGSDATIVSIEFSQRLLIESAKNKTIPLRNTQEAINHCRELIEGIGSSETEI